MVCKVGEVSVEDSIVCGDTTRITPAATPAPRALVRISSIRFGILHTHKLSLVVFRCFRLQRACDGGHLRSLLINGAFPGHARSKQTRLSTLSGCRHLDAVSNSCCIQNCSRCDTVEFCAFSRQPLPCKHSRHPSRSSIDFFF